MSTSIVQFWDQGSVPQVIRERTIRWREFNPNWDYHMLDCSSAVEFLDGYFGSSLAQAFLDIRIPAMKADVLRVAYLLKRGGFWIDVSSICKAPICCWLDLAAPLVMTRKPKMEPPLVCNGLIYASRPGHRFLADLWAHISQVIIQRQVAGIWKLVGPGAYRDLLRSGNYDDCIKIFQVADLTDYFSFSSTGLLLSPDQHWSKRQLEEPLYRSHTS